MIIVVYFLPHTMGKMEGSVTVRKLSLIHGFVYEGLNDPRN